MIKFNISKDFPIGKIRVDITDEINSKFKGPFKFECINTISNNLIWLTENMTLGWWSECIETTNCLATLTDSNGVIIDKWIYDIKKHGDDLSKIFLEWCENNPGSKGIAIGTNDGSSGEWVIPTIKGLINSVLVEASEKNFLQLKEIYKNYNNVNFNMNLVTADGSDVIFYECAEGAGTVNSVIKEHVLNYTQNIIEVNKKSISLNDLIIQSGLEKDIKWLHIDVEGIDDELILSLDSNIVRLPEVIIYEHINLPSYRKDKVTDWLKDNNYTFIEYGYNTLATRKKIDLSLLIHTCDSYERFWNGMFYTLDFYWDYDKIPVYFANEEKPMSDIIFNCKGYEYRPDKRINQILTGKSPDKYGFSTRFIEAVKQIPSKYVLYIQEDMWLKRSLDYKTLESIINFMEENNADSVRLHAKLFYYESYKLEPTDTIISGKRILKNAGGHILSHNATIWRKDYILKHQVPNEDPWSNEIEGSKRMSVDNNNNYHYDVHWYCQPGIADKGEYSPEALIYSHIVDEMKKTELMFKI